LSSHDTLEQTPETIETAQEHVHDENCGHDHNHGPVLNPECTRELVLDIPADEVAKTFRSITANYRKYARIPGFRPGKVPEAVVRKRFAAEIRKDVLDALLPERFNKAVTELGIKPVGQPQVTELVVEDDQPLHVKAVFEFIPEFSIDGYKDVVVAKPSAEVTEEEFEQELEQLRISRATIEPVEEERAIVDGDWVEISYSGIVSEDADAAPIAGDSAMVEVGGKDTVEAFTTILRGATVGQELKAEVIYPTDYAEPRLAGKTVSYEVAVKGIKKRILPELTDEFAQEMGSYENLEELKNKIREYQANRKQRGVESETKEKLFNAIAEKFTFALPESLIQHQIDERLERGLRALQQQGMTTEAMRKLDLSRLREAQRDAAINETKIALILDRIANEENITLDEAEVESELQIAAMQARESVDALRDRLTQDGSLARIREQMLREKTAHLLYERLPA